MGVVRFIQKHPVVSPDVRYDADEAGERRWCAR